MNSTLDQMKTTQLCIKLDVCVQSSSICQKYDRNCIDISIIQYLIINDFQRRVLHLSQL